MYAERRVTGIFGMPSEMRMVVGLSSATLRVKPVIEEHLTVFPVHQLERTYIYAERRVTGTFGMLSGTQMVVGLSSVTLRVKLVIEGHSAVLPVHQLERTYIVPDRKRQTAVHLADFQAKARSKIKVPGSKNWRIIRIFEKAQCVQHCVSIE